MRILLHTCCAPCLIAPFESLTSEGHQVTAFFHNPNVMPYREFRARVGAFKEYTAQNQIPAICDEDYLLEPTLRSLLDGMAASRCRACYDLRLNKTAQTAAEKGYDAFTTTLLVSPYQNHKAICDAAAAAAARFGVKFHYADWRPLFTKAHEEASSKKLYMQSYCGCIFSEEERYRPSLRKKMAKPHSKEEVCAC